MADNDITYKPADGSGQQSGDISQYGNGSQSGDYQQSGGYSDAGSQQNAPLQRERVRYAPEASQPQAQVQTQAQSRQPSGTPCPYCGTMNEAEAMYCASCGRAIRSVLCPYCGEMIDADADYCEQCHHYVKSDTCSFCGAHFTAADTFCPSCGSPKGGIVCPVCNTLNDFSFCKQCGHPLTHEAQAIMQKLSQNKVYQELQRLTEEYQRLNAVLPVSSEQEEVREKQSEELRRRVLLLLQQDAGVPSPEVPEPAEARPSEAQLKEDKEKLVMQLASLLDKMQMPAMKSPAKARNYAMACKPQGVRTGWVCNYKHAVHSSPCGCAKPQLGGKWIVLSKS